MHAIIDGDILTHRIGYTTETEDFQIAKWRMDELLDRILEETNANSFTIFLSDSTQNNYRTKIYPQYKANRTQPKPIHLEGLKYYLVSDHAAIMTAEQEADDAMGILQCKYYNKDHSIICSIDKDLLQIPGWHYNFVKQEKSYITKEQGLYKFYTQLLMGDKVDNIPGIYGIGPKKAEKALEGLSGEDHYFEECKAQYEKAGLTLGHLLVYGRLLKIRTKDDELWQFPQAFSDIQPSEESLLSFSQMKVEENIPSSEPTLQE